MAENPGAGPMASLTAASADSEAPSGSRNGSHGCASDTIALASNPRVMPLPVLLGSGGASLLLLGIMVGASNFELGSLGNLGAAMGVAFLMATLALAVFMRLVLDRPFNLLLLVFGALFSGLLVAVLVTDRTAYQPSIDQFDVAKAAAAAASAVP